MEVAARQVEEHAASQELPPEQTKIVEETVAGSALEYCQTIAQDDAVASEECSEHAGGEIAGQGNL